MKAKIMKGNGFRGVLDYALDKRNALIVGGNMSGTSPIALSQEFAVARNLRENVKNPVWHCSLALPPGEDLTPEKWNDVTNRYMKLMGFSDLNQFTVVKHEDTEHKHVHIIANRIGLDGKIWHGQQDVFKAISATQQIEKEFDLTVTAGLDNQPDVKPATKNEIEMALRTDEAPKKLIIQNVIDAVLVRKVSIFEFIDELKIAGITALPSVASTGTMNGFSFEYEGIPFKGSQLGKKYAWKQLNENGVVYDKTRDGEKLIAKASEAKNKSDRTGSREIQPGGSERSPSIDNTISSDNEGRSATSIKQVSRSGIDDRDVEGSRPGHSKGNPNNVQSEPKGRAWAGGSVGGNAPKDREISRPNVGNVLHDAQRKMETINGHLSGIASDWDGVRSDLANLDATNPEPNKLINDKDYKVKVNAWSKQHEALNSPHYRLTLVSRVDGRRISLGKGNGVDGAEKKYNADEVKDFIPLLRSYNARGFDIYITPLDPYYHYGVIDDVKEESRKIVTDEYKPCLVQKSSDDNYQAIIKFRKEPSENEQSMANTAVLDINTKYGDKKFSGVVHPFRMAGFSNKKTGRENAFTVIVENFKGYVSEVLNSAMDKLRHFYNAPYVNTTPPIVSSSGPVFGTPKNYKAIFGNDVGVISESVFTRTYKQIVGLTESKGWSADDSRIDFRVAVQLLKKYNADDVEKALKNFSPDISQRHKNVDQYVSMTVANAGNSGGSTNKNGLKNGI